MSSTQFRQKLNLIDAACLRWGPKNWKLSSSCAGKTCSSIYYVQGRQQHILGRSDKLGNNVSSPGTFGHLINIQFNRQNWWILAHCKMTGWQKHILGSHDVKETGKGTNWKSLDHLFCTGPWSTAERKL